MLKNKNILVGITGGIAAFKSAELVRLLRKSGANVRVVMTKNALEFMTPLTLQTLSGNTVYTEMFVQNTKANIEHIALACWADLILVAPASANFLARLTYGLADDLLTTVCLASTAKLAVCPAMNREMWGAAITQNNIKLLENRGVVISGPAAGIQACGEIGDGRMLEPAAIVDSILPIFNCKNFNNQKIIITAGPTQEAIDPVRYLTNYSSGKMGYAIAEAAAAAGAQVVLISGPTSLSCSAKIQKIAVKSAAEMAAAVMAEIPNCTIFVAAAAVCDYRPQKVAVHKIKKTTATLQLELVKNPDILAAVAALPQKPFVVGFAAETENLEANALQKLQTKNLDMLVANQVGPNLGFDSDENELLILFRDAAPIKLARTTKTKLAQQLVAMIGKSQYTTNFHN